MLSAWALFAVSLVHLAARSATDAAWPRADGLTIDGLTSLMWGVVTFFGAVVQTFARRYMAGEPGETRFAALVTAFTLTVMLLVAADHLAFFALAWVAMGLLMAHLIGHDQGAPQARAAARFARRHFLLGGGLLTASFAALAWASGASTITGLAPEAAELPRAVVLLAGAGVVGAAVIQAALFPFHTWLLSSMTAPTPASALMHAGFVNGGGILLVRMAPVLALEPVVLTAAFVLGAFSALFGKLVKGVQADAKRQLGCSTVGQMGFMILQAGLGFFAAALTHLVLHGLYKAYAFLSVGDEIKRKAPAGKAAPGLPALGPTVAALVAALLGGALFATVTGKGTRLDSGLLLVTFVVLTTFHAAQRTLRQTGLPRRIRHFVLPLAIPAAIGLYLAVYLGVKALLAGLPFVTAPLPLTPLHLAVAGVFLVAYVAIEAGLHTRSDRLYVRLMNASQPPVATLFAVPEDRS